MKQPILPVAMLLGALALVPLVMVARARVSKSDLPRIHLVPDMDSQPKFKAQAANPLFADGRAMRLPVEGTVARGELHDDEHLELGKLNGVWAETFPVAVTADLMQRGRERFDIYCAPCHGLAGAGDGIVHQRSVALQEGTWVPPTSLHDDTVRIRPVGHLFNTITRGIRNMPAYGSQIALKDRWAIVAYVRALQRSQHATLADVPAEMRDLVRPRPPQEGAGGAGGGTEQDPARGEAPPGEPRPGEKGERGAGADRKDR
ncbi:MAG: cytochrome c [Planctomycetota bacterium]